MDKIKKSILVAFSILLLFSSSISWSFPIATFNIEHFSKGTSLLNYSNDDVIAIANMIKESKADIFALQEITDKTSLTKLLNHLKGWKFSFCNPQKWSNLHLAFLWNTEEIAVIDPPRFLGKDELFLYSGNRETLFSQPPSLFARPPFMGTFKDKDTNTIFTLINVHLKSQYIDQKIGKEQSVHRNKEKHKQQIQYIENLLKLIGKQNVFILGDFNREDFIPTFPLFKLEKGYSNDNWKSNLDYFGIINLDEKLKDKKWKVYEIETAIPSKFVKGKEHPDHDIVVLKPCWW